MLAPGEESQLKISTPTIVFAHPFWTFHTLELGSLSNIESLLADWSHMNFGWLWHRNCAGRNNKNLPFVHTSSTWPTSMRSVSALPNKSWLPEDTRSDRTHWIGLEKQKAVSNKASFQYTLSWGTAAAAQQHSSEPRILSIAHPPRNLPHVTMPTQMRSALLEEGGRA